MSITRYPGPYPTTIRLLIQHLAAPVPSRAARPVRELIRRRATEQQGRALERLGHAIDYMVDSQLYLNPDATPKDEAEAIQILMRLNREVFAECAEVVSLRQGLKLRLLRLFALLHPATPKSGVA
jgi:hypothetical protein